MSELITYDIYIMSGLITYDKYIICVLITYDIYIISGLITQYDIYIIFLRYAPSCHLVASIVAFTHFFCRAFLLLLPKDF